MKIKENDPIKEVKSIMDALADPENVKQLFKRLEFIWTRYFSLFPVEYYFEEHFLISMDGITPKANMFSLPKEILLFESAKLFKDKKNIGFNEENAVHILLRKKESIVGYIKIGSNTRDFTQEEITKLEIISNFLNGAFKNIELDTISSNEVNYELMVEKSADIIYSCDFEGKFTYINPVGLKLSGFKIEEVIGVSFLNFIDPRHRDDARDFYQKQFRDMSPNTYYEYPILKKNGHLLWVGQNVQLITKKSRIIRFHAVARVLPL